MKKYVLSLLIFLTPFSLIACSTAINGTDITKEVNICYDVDQIWTNIKRNNLDASEYILQIKNLGTKWADIRDSNLKDSLRDISNFNLTENLKENHEKQNSISIRKVILTDLFLKFTSVNLACTEFGLTNKPFEQSEIEKTLLNIGTSGALLNLNGSSTIILPE